jgi:hypothetical protein
MSDVKEGLVGAVGEYYHEKLAMEKKSKADHRSHNHSPWKRRNCNMPIGY